MLVSITSVIPSSSLLIKSWSDAIKITEFFSFPPTASDLNTETNLINTISSLCLAITIAFFDFDQDLSIEGVSVSYINNSNVLIDLHETFLSLLPSKPSASPVVLGWSFILNVIAVRSAEYNDEGLNPFFAKAIPKTISSHNGDLSEIPKFELLMKVASNIAHEALSLDPFSMLEKMIRILPQDPLYASVFMSYIKASLPHVALTESFSDCINVILKPFPNIAQDLFLDEFGDKLYDSAALRFPFAISPFLKLSQCLSSNAFDALSNLDTFMQKLPRNFTDYCFVGDSNNIIELTQNICLIPPMTDMDDNNNNNNNTIVLPPKVCGTINNIGNTRYVIWNYKYNGWSYLGCYLERICNAASLNKANSYQFPSKIVTEIIQLFTSTLTSLGNTDKCRQFLTMATENLIETDIIDLIFQITEYALFLNCDELSSVCLGFASALLNVLPDRVWSFLGRSSILGRNGQQSSISTVLGSKEIVDGRYDLTLSALKLIKSLVDSSVRTILDSKVSTKVKSDVVAKFTSHTVMIFESFSYWAYSDPRQKVAISYECLSIFTNLLHYSFDIDEVSSLEDKVTSQLESAASYLTNQFLAPERVITRALKPLLGAIESSAWSITSLDSDYPLSSDETILIYSVLAFSSELVRARTFLRLPPSQLEKSLFSLSPHLSILFTRYPALRVVVMDLFISIIQSPWPSPEQPSLLAHLGMHAHMFISNLTGSLQNSLESEATVIKIAEFFSSIIESQQEGLSILLLTGRDTRKASHIEQEVTSLLQVTEKKVSMEDSADEVLLPLLRSMAAAYSNWKLGKFSSKPELAKSLIQFVDNRLKLDLTGELFDDSKLVEYSYKISIAEQSLLIFAVQLFKSPEGPGIQRFIEYLQKDFKILDISGVFFSIDKLQSLQHENLIKNFDFRWPQLGGLKKFAKSRFLPLTYGSSYIYDLNLLDIVLGDEKSWMGYRKEVISGNFSYSWVDSQLRLTQAWCTFCTSLATYLSKCLKMENNAIHKNLLVMLNEVSDIAVEKVIAEEYSTPVLLNSIETRLSLVFMIKYAAFKAGVSTKAYSSLLRIYNLLASPDYKLIEGISFNGRLDAPSITHKQLLRSIAIMLEDFKGITENNIQTYQILQIVTGLFGTVVINGMIAAVQAAISDPKAGADSNMVIIISILKKCLNLEGIKGLYPKVASLLSESQCVKSVMRLYSYTDVLTNANDEYVYGELALAYLLEWLNIDQIPDQLISNGLFDLLMESPISRKIQEGKVKPTTNSKLHNLWVKGILPILLTLLQKVGARIISDVLVLIDFFSEQIKFSMGAWKNPSEITVSVIIESTQLILLVDMLYKLTPSSEMLLHQLQDIIPLRDDLLNSIDYLLSHPRFLNATLIATTAEEKGLYLIEDTTDIPEGNKLLSLIQEDLKEFRELIERSDIGNFQI